MGKRRKRLLPWILVALGAALTLFALGMLLQTRVVLQYCAPAPVADAGGALRDLAEAARRLDEAMGESLSWTAAGGVCETQSLTAGESTQECSHVPHEAHQAP